MLYKVVGKSEKSSKRIDALKDFIGKNFNTSGKRLGLNSFVKEFGKFNDKKATLQAVSVPSLKEIQVATRLVAKEIKEKGGALIPVVFCENNVTTIQVRNVCEFAMYYSEIKASEKKLVDATTFIINYMNKHVEELDFNAIQTALDGMKD